MVQWRWRWRRRRRRRKRAGEVEEKWEGEIGPNNVHSGGIKHAMTHRVMTWWQGHLKDYPYAEAEAEAMTRKTLCAGSPRVRTRVEYPLGHPIGQRECPVWLWSTWRCGSFSCWIDFDSHTRRCILQSAENACTKWCWCWWWKCWDFKQRRPLLLWIPVP